MNTTAFEPSTQDVVAIIEQVWESFLGETPVVDDDVPAPTADRITALISVTGGWEGHVVLESTSALGSAIAAAMMAVDESAVAEADIADAVGELVNMIGGFIKSLAPGPSALSLPLVLSGRDTHASAPDTVPVCRAALTWRGEPVVVTVLSAAARTSKDTGHEDSDR